MRVALAEDQFLLRDGLVRLLSSYQIDVVAAIDNGTDIVPMVEGSGADLALLDIRMPPTQTDEGVRAALTLRRRRPGFPVVLLSQYVERLYVDELLSDERGGVGYLLKDRVFDDRHFIDSLRSVAAGGTSIDQEVVDQLLRRRRHGDALARLTPREREALSLMAEGDSNAQIASKMVISEKAVEKHINSLLMRLDLPPSASTSRRVLAVLTYLRS